MKKLTIALAVLACTAAFGAEKTRKPSSVELGAGSYQCQNSYKEIVASFYIRKDGTSTKVEILNASEYSDRNGVENCYMVDFKWLKSGRVEKSVECCPYGAN